MIALLLAAGVGKRMGKGTPPKCLSQMGGRSLLQMTMESLRACGVREMVIVVGYQAQKVEAEARRHARSMKLTFLPNKRFEEGAVLSLWTARDFLDRALLIMDADVVLPPAGYERLVRSIHPNCILVDPRASDTGEEQMVFGKGNRVLTITKRPSSEIKSQLTFLGESVGFLKLSREGGLVLRELLDQAVNKGLVNIEHEQTYPALFAKVPVGFERVDDLYWTEVDTPEDLSRAQQEILPRWQAEDCLNRVLAKRFLPKIVLLPITPNQWTLISFLSGLFSLYWMAQGTYLTGLLGAFFFQAFYVIDNWDGEVARAKGLSSSFGGWFDVATDAVIQILLPLSLAVGLNRTGHSSWVVNLSMVATAGIALDFFFTSWMKKRGYGPAIVGDPARTHFNPQSRLPRWIQINRTHENFSLGVVAVLTLELRLPFLILLAIGTHCFWMNYVWSQRKQFLRRSFTA